jgi:tetratricopeptide (TPR) repeat protein
MLAMRQGAYDVARAYFEERLVLSRELQVKGSIADTLSSLGMVALYQGEYAVAQAYLEEGLMLHQDMGYKRGSARALSNLGYVARDTGDVARAAVLFAQAVALWRELQDTVGIAWGSWHVIRATMNRPLAGARKR